MGVQPLVSRQIGAAEAKEPSMSNHKSKHKRNPENYTKSGRVKRSVYEAELARLQEEFVNLQH